MDDSVRMCGPPSTTTDEEHGQSNRSIDVDPLLAIVNAGRDRLVRIEPWGEFSVAPPTVRHVLTVLACGKEDDEPVFWESVSEWMPTELIDLMRTYKDDGVSFEFALTIAGRCIQDGAIEIPKTDVSDIENPSDWQDLFADYAHAYGLSFNQILDELWHGFVLMSQKIAQVYARDQYRGIEAQSLPHIRDDRQRYEAYESLKTKAKLPRLTEEAERRLQLEQQRENLKKLKDILPSTKDYRPNGNN